MGRPILVQLAALAMLCLATIGLFVSSAVAQGATTDTTAQPQGPATTSPGTSPGGKTASADDAKKKGVSDESVLTFTETAKALGKLFIAAVILESAFAVIFKSKLYQEFFNGRGLTTPLLVLLCYAVAYAFGIDRVLADILRKLSDPPEPLSEAVSSWSTVLTALTLAGGSAGVNAMLQAFGYRVPPPPAALQKPAETKAWISVRVIDPQSRAVAAVVRIEKVDDTTVDHLKDVAGITGRDTVLVRLQRLMFPDPRRFPRYGGHTLEAGTIYRIEATPFDKLLTTDPIVASYASRAIVDFTIVARRR